MGYVWFFFFFFFIFGILNKFYIWVNNFFLKVFSRFFRHFLSSFSFLYILESSTKHQDPHSHTNLSLSLSLSLSLCLITTNFQVHWIHQSYPWGWVVSKIDYIICVLILSNLLYKFANVVNRIWLIRLATIFLFEEILKLKNWIS